MTRCKRQTSSSQAIHCARLCFLSRSLLSYTSHCTNTRRELCTAFIRPRASHPSYRRFRKQSSFEERHFHWCRRSHLYGSWVQGFQWDFCLWRSTNTSSLHSLRNIVRGSELSCFGCLRDSKHETYSQHAGSQWKGCNPILSSRIFHWRPNLVVLKIASVEVNIVFDKDAGRIPV